MLFATGLEKNFSANSWVTRIFIKISFAYTKSDSAMPLWCESFIHSPTFHISSEFVDESNSE